MGYLKERAELNTARHLLLGKILEAGARLEWNATRLLANLLSVGAPTAARIAKRMSATQILTLASTLAGEIPEDRLRERVLSTIEASQEALRTRNMVVHSRWLLLGEFVEVTNNRVTLDPNQDTGVQVSRVAMTELQAALDEITDAASALDRMASRIPNARAHPRSILCVSARLLSREAEPGV